MYNEHDVIDMFVARLRPVLDAMNTDQLLDAYEVIAVDDGSTDTTAADLTRWQRHWPELRIIRLRANAGHQAALSAGLAAASGAWVASLDADLQDPPETLREMMTATTGREVDIVYGVRSDRSTDTPFKRWTAEAYYALMRKLVGRHVASNAGDFRLMSRATVNAINTLPEHNRVLRLVVPSLGFPSTTVTYVRAERAAGATKYPLSRMIRLTLDSLTGFSVAPLRMATWAGLGGGLLTGLLFTYAVAAWALGQTLPGWTSTFLVVAGIGSVQLLCLGILGEYVGRLYTQAQQRPAYFVAYDSAGSSSPGMTLTTNNTN